MNRRVGGIIAAVVLALFGAVLVLAYAGNADSRAQEGQKLVSVFVVQSEIPAGTSVSELGDRVAKKSLPKNAIAEGAITNLDQVKDLVSGAILVTGEQLIRARFTTPSAFQSTGSSLSIPPGLVTTTISLSADRAVGGVLTPGSTVLVTASFPSDGSIPTQTGVILQRILVTNVQVGDPSAVAADGAKTPDANLPGVTPQGEILVTLAIEPASLTKLIYAAEHGTIWLSADPKTAPNAPGGAATRSSVYQ